MMILTTLLLNNLKFSIDNFLCLFRQGGKQDGEKYCVSRDWLDYCKKLVVYGFFYKPVLAID